MSETKRVWKIFWAWQDQKEEQWLREMSLKGWAISKYRIFYYTFKKIEPCDYVYKIDYKPTSNHDLNEYKQLFKDAGWEHILQFSGWHYFKIKANNLDEQDIYTDNESKIQKYKSLLSTIIIALIAVLSIFSSVVINSNNGILFIMYIAIILLLAICVFKVRKKIERLKNK